MKRGYDDIFLIRNGAKEGLQIIMTPSAYMTTEAWEEMGSKYCAGLQKYNRHVAAI